MRNAPRPPPALRLPSAVSLDWRRFTRRVSALCLALVTCCCIGGSASTRAVSSCRLDAALSQGQAFCALILH